MIFTQTTFTLTLFVYCQNGWRTEISVGLKKHPCRSETHIDGDLNLPACPDTHLRKEQDNITDLSSVFLLNQILLCSSLLHINLCHVSVSVSRNFRKPAHKYCLIRQLVQSQIVWLSWFWLFLVLLCPPLYTLSSTAVTVTLRQATAHLLTMPPHSPLSVILDDLTRRLMGMLVVISPYNGYD